MHQLKSYQHLILLLLLFFTGISSGFAATITVTNGSNTGTGSLRNAIASAVSGDIIVFSGVSTVTLTSGELLIDKNLTIDGGASGVTVTRSGGSQFRIFHIASGTVTLNKLTVTNGNLPGGGGGGLALDQAGTLNLNSCVFSGNSATEGAGIVLGGNATISNCTITGNSTSSNSTVGGGLLVYPPTVLVITGSTISNNTNGQGGAGFDIRGGGGGSSHVTVTNCTISGNAEHGFISPNPQNTSILTNVTITNNSVGLQNFSGNVTLKNCIVADNTSFDILSNISSSSSFNLIGTGGSGGLSNGANSNQVGVANPGLLPLASNGGVTQTHALSGCSPAINAGTNSGAPSTDQRGSSRPFGGTTDIGAYELQSSATVVNVNGTVTDVTCAGAANGIIDLTVSGGTSPYTYTWTGTGTGTDPRTNLGPGTYTVTVTDNAGCSDVYTGTVTQPSAININRTITNVTCNGGNNGSIDLSVTGGLGAYSYNWSGVGTGTDPRTNLTAGTYTVTVTDGNGCTRTNVSTVTEPSIISVTGSVTNVTCNGSANGSVNLTVTGGNGTYSYAWSGTGTGTDPRTNLAAGTYTVTVTDGNNCTQTNSFTVTEPAAISVTGVVTNVTCNGGTTGAVNLTVTGGVGAYSYAWSGTGTGTDPRTGLAAGTYTVTVTDSNNCTKTNSFNVTEPSAISITGVVTNVTCNGGTNGSVNLTVTGGVGIYSYAWSGVGTGTDPRTGLAAGTYTVTITDSNSCTKTSSFVISQPVPISITASVGSATCSASNGSITLTVTGGVGFLTYAWTGAGVGGNPRVNLAAGTYTVTVTDDNNCTKTASVTVGNLGSAIIVSPSVNNATCGMSNGSISLALSGAVAPVTYNWTGVGTGTNPRINLAAGTYTVTITDGNGCSAISTNTVAAPDVTPPTITCPANTTVAAGANCNATLASYVAAATASDNCTANPVITQSPASGTIITGSQVVTMTATDASGNSATCSFTVTVADQTPPTITCPSNTTVAASANCNATLASYVAAATASDNCTASPTKTQSPAAGTVITGSQVVTLTATDAAGNTATCSFTVTVADQTPPTITCPVNTTVAAGANCTATLASYTAAATASDNCTASPTKTQNPFPGSSMAGLQVVTLTATDAAGNTATCSFIITIADQTPPTINCPANTTVAASAACNATVAAYAAAATASDNCTTLPAKTQSPAVGTVITGSQMVTLTATDAAGNTGTCSFTVTVADQTPPTITCPVNTTVAAGANCSTTLASYTAAATASDNCTASPTKTQSPVAGTTISGSQVVTLTATDAAGNTATCSFTVTVTDQTAPTIACPSNSTVNADVNGNYTLTSYAASTTSSDNCTANPAETQSPAPGTILGIGMQVITMTATDGVGLSSTCSFVLTVQPGCFAPTVTCPANATLAAGANCTVALGNYTPSVTVTGGCGTSTLTQSPAAGTSLALGVHTITVTATDVNGNTGTCSFSVTVTDQTVPTITCPANATVAAGANCTATLASYVAAATASDNCTASPTKTQSPVAGTTISGSQVVTLTATDAAGNTATCSFTVTVADQTAPSITCPANATVAAGANCTATLASYVASATASDNCTASPTKTQSPAAGTTISGTQVVTLTATDAAGNTATCSFTVTVVDQTAPSITCPANATVAAGANCTATLASYTAAASASDNCTASPTKTQSPAAGTVLNIGNHVIVMTATDGAGLTSTCSFTVTVADQTAPTIVCRPASVSLNAAGAGSITPASVYLSGSDNCGTVNLQSVTPSAFTCANLGVNTVTLTVNDGNGNIATCNATVTVSDNLAPTVICQNFTANLSPAGNVSITPANVFQSGTDNCGIVNLVSVTPNTFTCSNVGLNTVTLTVNDGHGNTASCNAVVTVRDVTPPTAICQNAVVNLPSNGTLTLSPSTVNNGSSDNCQLNLSVSPAVFTCANIGLNVITLTATDGGGNTATCTARVTVRDQSGPTALCKNATIFLNTVGQATLSASQINNNSFDPCGIATMNLSKTSFNCSEIGSPQQVFLSVIDANGNASTCFSYVTVRDAIAPTAICQDVEVELGANGKVTVQGSVLAGQSFDNCSVWSYSPVAKVYTSANIGDNNLTITVKDWSNNASTCVSVVTVVPAGGLWGNGENTTTLIDLDEQEIELSSDNEEVIENREDTQLVPAEKLELHLYPNPTMGDAFVRFELPADQEYRLTVYDLAGRVVIIRKGYGFEGENLLTLPLGEVSPGMYTIEIRTAQLFAQKRILRQE